MSVLKIGDFAPNFQCKDQNGNLISLSDFKGKKVVLCKIITNILVEAVKPFSSSP